MFNFFKKPRSKFVSIKCSQTHLEIEGKSLTFPTSLEKLVEIFGDASSTTKTKRTKSTICCWDAYGIYCNYVTSSIIDSFSFIITHDHKLELAPKWLFKGEIFNDDGKIDGESMITVECRDYVIKKLTYKDYKIPYALNFRAKFLSEKAIPMDKYSIIKPEGAMIEFQDFGFKLAIIQELMYHQGCLEPKFELLEFVKGYEKRIIDIDKEGYEPIPEAIQYFKDLPISKSIAANVTEIYQDGGNAVYMQLLPFGEGDEDYWDILSVEDAAHFPNLHKITLSYASVDICNSFNALGIDTKFI